MMMSRPENYCRLSASAYRARRSAVLRSRTFYWESAVAASLRGKGNTKQWKGSGSLGKERSKCAVLTVDFAALFRIYVLKTICGRSIEKAAADVASTALGSDAQDVGRDSEPDITKPVSAKNELGAISLIHSCVGGVGYSPPPMKRSDVESSLTPRAWNAAKSSCSLEQSATCEAILCNVREISHGSWRQQRSYDAELIPGPGICRRRCISTQVGWLNLPAFTRALVTRSKRSRSMTKLLPSWRTHGLECYRHQVPDAIAHLRAEMEWARKPFPLCP